MSLFPLPPYVGFIYLFGKIVSGSRWNVLSFYRGISMETLPCWPDFKVWAVNDWQEASASIDTHKIHTFTAWKAVYVIGV